MDKYIWKTNTYTAEAVTGEEPMGKLTVALNDFYLSEKSIERLKNIPLEDNKQLREICYELYDIMSSQDLSMEDVWVLCSSFTTGELVPGCIIKPDREEIEIPVVVPEPNGDQMSLF